MLFGKKSQEQLDAAFLNAVAKHKFKKARKLLDEGANVHAVDDEGNTVFHKVASYCPRYSDAKAVRQFISFLITEKKMDINIRNAVGRNCVHSAITHDSDYYYSEGRRYSGEMTGLLVSCGALIDIKDEWGVTPLHLAAHPRSEELINKYFLTHVGIADNEGKYPHDYAFANGHHGLGLQLRRIFEQRQAVEKTETLPPVAVPPLPLNDTWTWQTPKLLVQHVEAVGGYRLTHLFNFSARTYTLFTQNLETKQEAPPVLKGFDEFIDRSLIVEARQALVDLGGDVSESVIHTPQLAKPRPVARD